MRENIASRRRRRALVLFQNAVIGITENQHITDWSNSIGNTNPTDWTTTHDLGASFWPTVEDPTNAPGVKVLKSTISTRDRYGLIYSALSGAFAQEVYLEYSWTINAGHTGDIYPGGPLLHTSGGATTEAGYRLTLKAFATSAGVMDVAGREIVLSRYTGGGHFTIASLPFSWNSGTVYCYRARIESGVFYGKIWERGTEEPASWTISVADASYTSGGLGLQFHEAGVHRAYLISLAVNGETALKTIPEGYLTGAETTYFDAPSDFTPDAIPGKYTRLLAQTDIWRARTGPYIEAISHAISATTTKGLGFTEMGRQGDQEVYCEMMIPLASMIINSRYGGPAVRMTGTGPYSAYGVALHLGSSTTDTAQRFFTLHKMDNVASGRGSQAAFAAFIWQPDIWYSMRLRVNNNVIQAKIWAAGSAEPGTWNIASYTDATITATLRTGTPGIWHSGKEIASTNPAVRYRSIGIARDGHTAPVS